MALYGKMGLEGIVFVSYRGNLRKAYWKLVE